MSEMFEKIWRIITESNVLNIIGGLVILAVGWIISLVAKNSVSSLLKKAKIGSKLAIILPEGDEKKPEIFEKIISGIVFWILFLLTLIACLSALNLTEAAEPISALLDKLVAFLPNILAAAVLCLVAWLVSSGLKYGTSLLLSHLKLDEKIERNCDTNGRGCELSSTIASVVAALTWLFFLPAILSALNISGITEPIQSLLDKILTYLPNLAAGAAIAAAGLICASILRKLTLKALSAPAADAVGEKIGFKNSVTPGKLAVPVSIIVYALVALPVVAAVLDALKLDILASSTGELFSRMLNAFGNVFGALLIVVAAWIAGSVAAKIIREILAASGFNKLFRILGFVKEDTPETTCATDFAGKLVLTVIMLFGIICALDLLEFHSLAEILRSFIPFCGKIILAAIVFCLGIYLSKFAVSSAKANGWETKLLLCAIRIAILIFAGAVALYCTGIGEPIVHTAFLLIGGTAAVAVALAFGLGGRDFAAKKLEEWSKSDVFTKK